VTQARSADNGFALLIVLWAMVLLTLLIQHLAHLPRVAQRRKRRKKRNSCRLDHGTPQP
jgi:Tfp pilus assembly protein PilX